MIKRELRRIPIDSIHPNPQQPRHYFDEDGLRELAASMVEHGLIQPIEVEPDDGDGYILHHGERRWRAAQMLGWGEIEVLVSEPITDQQRRIRALIENIQRQDMRPGEIAACYQALVDAGLKRYQIARRTGHSQETIAAYLRLRELPAAVQQKVDEGLLPIDRRVSAALLAIADEADREQLALKLAQPGQTIAGILTAVEIYQELKRPTAKSAAPRAGRADCGRPRAGLSNLVSTVWGNCPRPPGAVYDVAEQACARCVFAPDSPTLACAECRLVAFVRLYEAEGGR